MWLFPKDLLTKDGLNAYYKQFNLPYKVFVLRTKEVRELEYDTKTLKVPIEIKIEDEEGNHFNTIPFKPRRKYPVETSEVKSSTYHPCVFILSNKEADGTMTFYNTGIYQNGGRNPVYRIGEVMFDKVLDVSFLGGEDDFYIAYIWKNNTVYACFYDMHMKLVRVCVPHINISLEEALQITYASGQIFDENLWHPIVEDGKLNYKEYKKQGWLFQTFYCSPFGKKIKLATVVKEENRENNLWKFDIETGSIKPYDKEKHIEAIAKRWYQYTPYQGIGLECEILSKYLNLKEHKQRVPEDFIKKMPECHFISHLIRKQFVNFQYGSGIHKYDICSAFSSNPDKKVSCKLRTTGNHYNNHGLNLVIDVPFYIFSNPSHSLIMATRKKNNILNLRMKII